MRPCEEGYPGQVDRHLAALTAGRSWPVGKGPVDVVVGNPGDGADGATSSGEMDEVPGAVTGVLAHPGASQNGPEAWGHHIRSTTSALRLWRSGRQQYPANERGQQSPTQVRVVRPGNEGPLGAT